MKFEFSRQTFEKLSNIKFYQNPSSGSRVVPSGQTNEQTDMTKVTVAFRNFTDAPNMLPVLYQNCILFYVLWNI
jgi:hypothetical protein